MTQVADLTGTQLFYVEARVYHPAGPYWTVGLVITAPDMIEAIQHVHHWNMGLALSGLYCKLESVSTSKTRGRGYQTPDSPVLKHEILNFKLDMDEKYPNGKKES